MKKEYIDQYGLDSLPNLIIASLNKLDIFVTSNKEMIKDRKELEKVYKIKIRTPKELLEKKNEQHQRISEIKKIDHQRIGFRNKRITERQRI